MSVRMAPLPLLFLLMIQGVSSADWGVSYSPRHICALNDSTVIMRCTYKYPTKYKIKKAFWTKGPIQRGVEPPDLSNDPEYSQRLHLGDKQQNCTVRLSHVTLKDSRMYYFRFISDKPNGKWTGDPGVTLTVTDLQVESPERVTEGDSVSLTCKSSCALTDRATFIWYRNSQKILTESKFRNTLILNPVRREDSGRYSCAVDGHTHVSPDVQINVMYPLRNISVSISPSGVIVEGDSVTLNCISDSNPPALNFSWFKGGTIVGSGRIFIISKIRSDDSGEYKCKSFNEHGEKYSDAVTLNVMYPPKSVSVSISPSGVIVEGDSVTLKCISDSNPPAGIRWFKGGTIVGSGRIFNISKIRSDDSEKYKCRSFNKHGEKYSDTVTLNIMYPPRSVSVSIIQSGQIWAGDSVTLKCISDSNPPAVNFSWFKENESSAVGSGQSFSALQSGRFYCQAHNQHGSQRSDAVTVTVHHGAGRNVIVITATSGGVFIIFIIIIIIIILIILKKRRSVKVEDIKENDLYSDASQGVSVHDKPLSEPDLVNNAQYASVKPKRFRGTTSESRDTEEIQYATVQHHRKTETKSAEENESQRDEIRDHEPDPAVRRSDVQTVEDPSVIYSAVK